MNNKAFVPPTTRAILKKGRLVSRPLRWTLFFIGVLFMALSRIHFILSFVSLVDESVYVLVFGALLVIIAATFTNSWSVSPDEIFSHKSDSNVLWNKAPNTEDPESKIGEDNNQKD